MNEIFPPCHCDDEDDGDLSDDEDIGRYDRSDASRTADEGATTDDDEHDISDNEIKFKIDDRLPKPKFMAIQIDWKFSQLTDHQHTYSIIRRSNFCYFSVLFWTNSHKNVVNHKVIVYKYDDDQWPTTHNAVSNSSVWRDECSSFSSSSFIDDLSTLPGYVTMNTSVEILV